MSRNTVGTHMRHIYQKANVHDRQQFIDEVLLHVSHSSRDTDEQLT
ncbi:MAG: LuxR C-terminal-related transcriptional regulator [Raoultibacter sp.]